MMTDHPLFNPILTSLQTQYNLPVSRSWLSTFLSTANQNQPLVALTSTARFRILVSDIKTSLSVDDDDAAAASAAAAAAVASLPRDINDVNVKQKILSTNVVVQVLDIVDVGTSKWNQVEAIERVERGEEVRGREVIRSVASLTEGGGATEGEGGGAGAAGGTGGTRSKSSGPHKLILQDARGTNVTGFELVQLPQVFIGDGGISIGCKLLLQSGTVVRRGMVMMTPETVVMMGGKVESWDSKWRELRKERLVKDVQRQIEEREGERARTG